MVKVALYVRLEAKPGKEAEVEKFLKDGLSVVQQEPATTAWFGIHMGPSTFGIFDAFPDEAGRQAHLNGKVAAALMAKAPELLASLRKSRKSTFLQRSLARVEPAGVVPQGVLRRSAAGRWLRQQDLATPPSR